MDTRSLDSRSSPRRRSMVGPQVMSAPIPAHGPHTFAVTEKYVKGGEGNKLGNMLKDARVAESVKISGPVNIVGKM